jgi:type II secretory pathway pseudopilin PulG
MRFAGGRLGLTLIELLIASALGVLVTALAFTAFLRAKSTVARTSARVELHQSAAVLQDAFEQDFGSLAPAMAVFVRSTPTFSGGSLTGEDVEVVFMRSTAPLDKQAPRDANDNYLADHHWVRWRFVRTIVSVNGVQKTKMAVLRRAASSPQRVWQTNAALATASPVQPPEGGGTKSNYDGARWLNIPRPLRDASDGIASLDFNRYGIPPAAIHMNTPNGDIGDLADLDAHDHIASTSIRDFQIGWVDAAGNSVVVDGEHAADHRIDGLYMDIVGPDNGRYLDRSQNPVASVPGVARDPLLLQYDYRPVLAARPRLLRYTMRLEDQATGISQTFAGSIAIPGMMPPINRPTP